MKLHQVKLEAGKNYVVLLNSGDCDSFLRLESPSGTKILEDDDGGGFPNARIDFRPPATGLYRIVVTSFDGKFGPYRECTSWNPQAAASQAPSPTPTPCRRPRCQFPCLRSASTPPKAIRT